MSKKENTVCDFGETCVLFECERDHPNGRKITKEHCNPNLCAYGKRCLKDHSLSYFLCRKKKCNDKKCNRAHVFCDHGDDCVQEECLQLKPFTSKTVNLEVNSAVDFPSIIPGLSKSARKRAAKKQQQAQMKLASAKFESENAVSEEKKEIVKEKVNPAAWKKPHISQELFKQVANVSSMNDYQLVINHVSTKFTIDTKSLEGLDKVNLIGSTINDIGKNKWKAAIKENNTIFLTPVDNSNSNVDANFHKEVIGVSLKSNMIVETDIEINVVNECSIFDRMLAISNKLKETSRMENWNSIYDMETRTVIATPINHNQ